MYSQKTFTLWQNVPINQKKGSAQEPTDFVRADKPLPDEKPSFDDVEWAVCASRYNQIVFPRAKRLPPTHFHETLRGGRRRSSEHFSAQFPANTRGYAVLISKKTAKRSVDRHHIKRKTLETLKTLPILPPSLILFPRATVLHMSYDDIRAELTTLLTTPP